MRRRFLLSLFGLGARALSAGGRNLGTVADESRPIRAVGLGDFGYRGSGSGQQAVAAAIAKLHAKTPFNCGLTFGDNFYNNGVTGVDDPVWKEIWEKSYGPLGIPFYATLGNHDYYGDAQAQVDYTARSETWRMPARYYTFRAGPVQFFALDTDEGTAGRLMFAKAWSNEQAKWLDEELGSCQAPWKAVYGHHPIYSDGHHGPERRLQRKLLPILRKHKVNVYVCGHEHELQHRHEDGIDFIVAGGGGKETRDVRKIRAEFAAGIHGFLEISATACQMDWNLRGADGAALHGRKLYK